MPADRLKPFNTEIMITPGDNTDVIDQFDHLYGRLKGYAPLPVKKNYNILAQLIFGNAAEEKRVQRIPRGVYLWGTVGGGTLTYLY